MRVIATPRYITVEFPIIVGSLSDASFGTLVEHCHDVSDDFEVTQLLCSNVNQHVSSAGIVLCKVLREIAACRRQFALRTTELFEHEIGKPGVTFINSDCVLQAFVMTKHQG